VYIAPDGSYSATYPSVRRRFAAGTVDWVLCWVIFLLASIVGGIVQGVGVASVDAGGPGVVLGVALVVLSQLMIAAPIVAYFAVYWSLGSTLGMRALDIELVEDRTGVPPTWKRTVPRAVIAFLIALAVLNVYFAYSGGVDELNAFERALVAASVAVAAVGVAAKAWLLIDPRRRSAFDRLFGLVYVEEFVYSDARPSPWLDAGR
jgi:RDD family